MAIGDDALSPTHVGIVFQGINKSAKHLDNECLSCRKARPIATVQAGGQTQQTHVDGARRGILPYPVCHACVQVRWEAHTHRHTEISQMYKHKATNTETSVVDSSWRSPAVVSACGVIWAWCVTASPRRRDSQDVSAPCTASGSPASFRSRLTCAVRRHARTYPNKKGHREHAHERFDLHRPC